MSQGPVVSDPSWPRNAAGSGPHPPCADGERDWQASHGEQGPRGTPSSSPGW